MKALDTNVLARYYLDDDARQSPVAFAVMQRERALFVSRTVLLELNWVLRFNPVNPQTEAATRAVLDHLVSLPNVTVEDVDVVRTALQLNARGIEFADALHLAAAHRCTAMLTFDDRRFARRARELGVKPAVVVPAQ